MKIRKWFFGSTYGSPYVLLETEEGKVFRLEKNQLIDIIEQAVKGKEIKDMGKKRKNSSFNTAIIKGDEKGENN